MEITWAVGLEATRCPMLSRVTRPTEACLASRLLFPQCLAHAAVKTPCTRPFAFLRASDFSALRFPARFRFPPFALGREQKRTRECCAPELQSSTDRNRDLHMLRQRSTAISCRSNGFFLEYYAGGDAPVKKIEPTRFVRRMLDETCVSTTAVPSLIQWGMNAENLGGRLCVYQPKMELEFLRGMYFWICCGCCMLLRCFCCCCFFFCFVFVCSACLLSWIFVSRSRDQPGVRV